MGTWNGKFTCFEVYFGYSAAKGRLEWQHMPRNDRSSQIGATANARDNSRSLKIFTGIYDALNLCWVAAFRHGEEVPISPAGELAPHAEAQPDRKAVEQQGSGP